MANYFNNIPNIAHFYWGGSRMSYLQYLTVVSFHKFNPSWQIKVHSSKEKYNGNVTWETESHKIPYTGINYLSQFKRLPYIEFVEFDFNEINISSQIPEVYKSDILRWKLLSTEGGLWSDMDILYFKPLEALNLTGIMKYGTVKEIDCLLIRLNNPMRQGVLWSYLIGFMLSSANNILFNDIYQISKSSLNLNEYQSVGAHILNKHYPYDSSIHSKYSDLSYAIGDMDIVYAYPPLSQTGEKDGLDKLFKQYDLSLITNNSIGVHWFNGTVIAEYFSNEFNHFTQYQFNNTITHYVKLLGDDANIKY